MGSSLAALAAGKKPDINPTTIHRATPEKIHTQGVIKLLPITIDVIFPIRIPSTMPIIPPS